MTAIEFENVGKQYRLGLVSTLTLSHDLKRWWTVNIRQKEDPYLRIGETNDRSTKGHSDYVWALKDISFKIEQGDVVGIIGRNGAGKSTMLKLLSKVTGPTTGAIRARGRIGSLLEVGTGFHPEMTGRENIYTNGAILGMTKLEISRKLDEIVDFSGCERYLDTPVKRYSSGMMVRLGFAVAAHLDPEILVVDEVLAVGDAEFQKKAIGKMKDVSQGEGRTVLFVSHNMAAVKNLCNTGIVLKNGRIDYLGTCSDAIGHYISAVDDYSDKLITDSIRYCSSFLKIEAILINGTNKAQSTVVANQEYIDIEIIGATDNEMRADIKMVFKTQAGIPLASLAEGHYKGNVDVIQPGKFHFKKRIGLPKYLSKGDYYIDVNLHQPSVCWYLRADNCAVLHAEGNSDQFGQATILTSDGMLGLECHNF